MIRISVETEDGQRLELPSVVKAMVHLVVSQRAAIAEQPRGSLELHYTNETCKVQAKLGRHLGFEKFDP